MDKQDEQITEQIKRVAAGSLDKAQVRMGIVKAVAEDLTSCTVELHAAGEGNVLTGVLLNTLNGNGNGGVLLVPVVGAACLVMSIDGGGRYELIKAKAYSSIDLLCDGGNSRVRVQGDSVFLQRNGLIASVNNETIELNGSGNGGVVKVAALVDKLNNLEQTINQFMALLQAWVPVPGDGGAALKAILGSWMLAGLTPTVAPDLASEVVKHG